MQEKPNSNINLQDIFLEQFSYSMRSQIIEYGKLISNIEADYVMFMARKSVCFYECLNRLKLASLGLKNKSSQVIAITDRLLDMDRAWLKGKRVALVDDALISGTSLYQVREQLLEAGAEVVDSFVFCISKEWWNEKTFRPSEPFLRLSHDETTRFCADIVRAISLVPYPYAVDYPIYQGLRIFDNDLQDIFSQPEWQVRNISTPLQVSKGVTSLVISPSSSLITRFSEEVKFDLTSIAQLIKIRLYGRHIDKHKLTWFTVMPIVVFDPIKVENIEILWEDLATSWTIEEGRSFRKGMTSAKSKLRFLQFLIAGELAKIWLSTLHQATEKKTIFQMDQNSIQYVFSPDLTSLITEYCNRKLKFNSSPVFEVAVVDNLVHNDRILLQLPNGDPWSMQARLIEPFLSLYRDEEIPARKLAKDIGYKIFENPEYHEKLNRLNRGLAISELRNFARGSDDGRSAAEVISEFLDYVIDRGFIVPTTLEKDGIVYRAYRHGEDIRDSEQFRVLVTTSISYFIKSANVNSIPNKWLENLIVLLTQLVVERNYVPPSDLKLGNSRTIGVRYEMNNIIVKEKIHHPYSHINGKYYSDILCKLGLLKKQQDNSYIVSEIPTEVPYKNEAISLSEELGIILGCLHSKKYKFMIDSDQFTNLLTCLTPISIASALVSTLMVFEDEWRYIKSNIKSFDDYIKAFLEPLNVGRSNFIAYLNNASRRLIEQSQNDLDSSDDVAEMLVSKAWRSIWSSQATFGKHSPEDPIVLLAHELGKITYEINILINYLHISFSPQSETAKKNYHEIQEMICEYQQHITYTNKIHGEIINIQSSIIEDFEIIRCQFEQHIAKSSLVKFDWNDFRKRTLSKIDHHVAYIPRKLEQLEKITASHGRKIDFNRFEHVLFVEFSHDPEIREKAKQNLDNLCHSSKIISKGNSVYLAFKDLPDPFIDQSRLIFARGDRAAQEIIRFYLKLLKLDRNKNNQLSSIKRIIIFRNIPRNEQPIEITGEGICCENEFLERLKSVLNNPLIVNHKTNEMIVISPSDSPHELFDIVVQNSGFSTELASQASFIFTSPIEKRFTVTVYPSIRQRRNRMKPLQADVGIICITPTELDAVLNILRKMEDYSEDKRFTFYSAKAIGDQGCIKIAFTAALSQGNVSIVSAYQALIQEYQPKLVVLVGMAGGIHKDVNLNDVIIADQVIYYEPSKSSANGNSHRGKTYPIHPKLKNLLNYFMSRGNTSGKKIFQSEQDNLRSEFTVHMGPIGTGEEIVGYKDADTKKWLQVLNDKTLAVETEAWGVTNAYYEQSAWPSNKKRNVQGVMVIRGIADHADENKSHDCQYLATQHALQTLLAFLSTLQPSDLDFGQ